MTGTGRRRKPSSGDEEPRPTEAPAAPSTWSTHAAPPEPEYTYDWREGGQAGQAQENPNPFQQPPPSSFPSPPPLVPPQASQYAPTPPIVPLPFEPPPPSSVPSQSEYARPAYNPSSQDQSYFAPRTFVQPPPYVPADSGPPGLFDDDALFDDNLFDTGQSAAAPATHPEAITPPRGAGSASASGAHSVPSAATGTAAATPAAEGERAPTKIASAAADYAFVEEETDAKDVKNWLTFVESRADSRAERTRRLRNRLIAAGVVVVLAVGGTLTYLWASGNPLLGGTTAPTRDAILLQVRDNTTENAVADAVLVADKSSGSSGASGATPSPGHGAAVLVPSQMVVNSISGSQPFGGDMTANPLVPPAGADTVADSLGVQVDGVWGMDETTFAALIDVFGGVQLTTNVAVPAVTAPAGGATNPAVARGAGKLDGNQALAYALYQGPGESIDTQVDRFGQVVDALLTEMPTTADLVTAYLNQLGVVPDPSLPEAKLATVLAELAAEQQGGDLTTKSLPLQNNATNQMDFAAAAPIISTLLGGTVQSGLASGAAPRILVENGTGQNSANSATIESAASARLINAGDSYVGSSDVSKRSKSEIEIPTSADQSAAAQVATILSLPTSDIQVVSGMSEISDITVVLGTDWVQTGMNG